MVCVSSLPVFLFQVLRKASDSSHIRWWGGFRSALYGALGARGVGIVGSGDMDGQAVKREGRSSTDSESVITWPWSSLCGRISAVSITFIETKKRQKIIFYS